MKFFNLITNDCVKENEYIGLILMCLFFIAGYLLFLKKPNFISPILKRKIYLDPDVYNEKNLEADKKEIKFFLDK